MEVVFFAGQLPEEVRVDPQGSPRSEPDKKYTSDTSRELLPHGELTQPRANGLNHIGMKSRRGKKTKQTENDTLPADHLKEIHKIQKDQSDQFTI